MNQTEVLRSTTSIRLLDQGADFFLFARGAELLRMEEGEEQLSLIHTAAYTIIHATFWQDSYYYVAESDLDFNADGLFRFDPMTQQLTEVYTSDFGGIKGHGRLK